MGNNNTPETTGKGLMGVSGDGQFPNELLKSNQDFNDATANCWFRDEAQRNAVILYAAQLRLCELSDDLEDLVAYLNGSLSINMTSRAQAIQAHVGMFYPQTSGMRINKDELKIYAGANKEAARSRRNHDEEEEKHD